MNWFWMIILIFNSFIFKEIHLGLFLVWLFLIFLSWNSWYLNMDHSNGQLVLLYQVYSNWCLYNELIFLNYLHSLLQVLHHSDIQLVLLYQVYSNWYLNNKLIFLIYLHSLQVINHSTPRLVSLWRVHNNSMSLLDIPFTYGLYSHGERAFKMLTINNINYDSSILLFYSYHY